MEGRGRSWGNPGVTEKHVNEISDEGKKLKTKLV